MFGFNPLESIRKVAAGFIKGLIGRGESVSDTVSTVTEGGLGYGDDLMTGDALTAWLDKINQDYGKPFDPGLPLPEMVFKDRPSNIGSKYQYVYRYAYYVEGIAGPVMQYFTINTNEILSQNDLQGDITKMLGNIETSTSIQVYDVEFVEGFHNPNVNDEPIPF